MRPLQFEFQMDTSRAGTGLQPVDRVVLADWLSRLLRLQGAQRPGPAHRAVESVVLAVKAATDAAPKITVPVMLLPADADRVRQAAENWERVASDRFQEDYHPAAFDALHFFRKNWEWQSGYDAGKRQLTQRGSEVSVLPGSGYGAPRKPPEAVQVAHEPGESASQYRKRFLDAIGA